MKLLYVCCIVFLVGCGTERSPNLVTVCGHDFLEHSNGTVTDIRGQVQPPTLYLGDTGCRYVVTSDGKVRVLQ